MVVHDMLAGVHTEEQLAVVALLTQVLAVVILLAEPKGLAQVLAVYALHMHTVPATPLAHALVELHLIVLFILLGVVLMVPVLRIQLTSMVLMLVLMLVLALRVLLHVPPSRRSHKSRVRGHSGE